MSGDRPDSPTRAHQGASAGLAADATSWSTAITATTARRVFVRGVALDEAIGRETFPSMVLRLWRGDSPTPAEADLLGACMVAAIDHGPLSPSALVTRTIASTRAMPMSALAGGILAFGELHGAVVTRAMRLIVDAPPPATRSAGRTRRSHPNGRPAGGFQASAIAGTSRTSVPSVS